MASLELNLFGKTVNRRAVADVELFEEGDFWHWRIVDALGRDYVDGGNHRTRESALADLQGAFDPVKS